MRGVEVFVREAVADDVGGAAALGLRAEAARTGGTPPSDDDVAGFSADLAAAVARPGARLFVAVSDGLVVATVYGVPLKADATKAQVAMLAVEPLMWGMGAGSRMLRELTIALREQGCTAMRMNVDPANARARALYERQGWRHAGETEIVEGALVPELVYRLDLG